MNGREIQAIDPFASRFDGGEEIGFDEGDASKAASSIRSVTRSPYTAAAIAATSAVAPPAGTAVAGVMTAGLGIAEGVAAGLKPAAKLVSAAKKIRFNPIKRKRKRKGSPAVAKLIETARQMSDAQLATSISQMKKLSRYSPKFVIVLKAQEAELQRRAKLRALSSKAATGSDRKSKAEVKETARKIAKLIVAASRGNTKARAAVLALESVASKPMQGAFIFRVARMRGLDNSTARQIAVGMASKSDLTKAWVLGNRLAEKMGARRPPKSKKVREVEKKAAREMATPSERAGVLVNVKMGKRRGKFRRSNKGQPGWLVGKRGLVTAGRWA